MDRLRSLHMNEEENEYDYDSFGEEEEEINHEDYGLRKKWNKNCAMV